MMQRNKTSREIALYVVNEVLEEKKLSHLVLREVLSKYEYGGLDETEKSFITRISQGTIERMITLDYVINLYSKKETEKMKPFIRGLLRISVYQIMFMNSVPDSAACNEAVKLAKKRGFTNLAPFVNGVLRNISREKDKISYPDESQNPLLAMSVKYSVPEWIIRLLIQENGEEVTKSVLESLFEDNAEETRGGASLSVRLNMSRTTKEEAIRCLKEEDVLVLETELADHMLKISNYGAVHRLKAFRQGMFQVQDLSSVLVGQISGVKKGDTIMDLCAAPGGKTIHLADLLNGTGMVIAGDISENKVKLIRENMDRCGFDNVKLQVQDAAKLEKTYINHADIVLADVPCSGLGVLKHKSDIKYRLKQEDIKELAKNSQNILKCAVQYLKRNGTLIFSTCTMTRAENDDIRSWLLEQFDLEPVDITPYLSDALLQIGKNKETAKEGYLKLFITEEYDGFFMAKFIKRG
ncbi:MAG: 16S rRNA (cytosine(967)-C(5))-methyltransferase RsmB [Lachnospiraceae bacterium]|nr:16S rRNA (cytosine(967)-C(5))-methyltransferase RsmB [Lachnospiraceae bacterium]